MVGCRVRERALRIKGELLALAEQPHRQTVVLRARRGDRSWFWSCWAGLHVNYYSYDQLWTNDVL